MLIHAVPIEKILVLEDDWIVRKHIEEQLRLRHYEVALASTLARSQELLATETFDLLLLDDRLPDGEGTDLLHQLPRHPQRPLIVIMSGFASGDAAAECLRDGAFDYLLKPFSGDQLEGVLRNAENFSQLLKVNYHLCHQVDADERSELLGKSASLETLRQLIRKVARTQATVLIQGESGTGKELVARELYRQSLRANAPFIRVHCASLPENLIESEFFGYEKGAFPGALQRREGRFELAQGGTILLDEIGEISPPLQAKLLRVLHEREFERVGSDHAIKVDVRVMATTSRPLEDRVERQAFRRDLFYRLNVVPITVPPLRQHREDIPQLAEHFLRRYARKHGSKVRALSNACFSVLLNHPWPGNVRELQHEIEQSVILCGAEECLQTKHLGLTPLAHRAAAPTG